jgi:hypothetical protein
MLYRVECAFSKSMVFDSYENAISHMRSLASQGYGSDLFINNRFVMSLSAGYVFTIK